MNQTIKEIIDNILSAREKLLSSDSISLEVEEYRSFLKKAIDEREALLRIWEDEPNSDDDERFNEVMDYTALIEEYDQKFKQALIENSDFDRSTLVRQNELLQLLIKLQKKVNRLKMIEQLSVYSENRVQVLTHFKNIREIDKIFVKEYNEIVATIQDLAERIIPLYNEVINDWKITKIIKEVTEDKSDRFGNNEPNPFETLKDCESNIRNIFLYDDTVITARYRGMAFPVSMGKLEKFLKNLQIISSIEKEYGISISTEFKAFLEEKNLNKDTPINFIDKIDISPEINVPVPIDGIQDEEPVIDYGNNYHNDLLLSYITNVKNILETKGRKQPIKFKGATYRVCKACAGKFLSNMMSINRLATNNHVDIPEDFINYLQEHNIDRKSQVYFGSNNPRKGESTLKVKKVEKAKNKNRIKKMITKITSVIAASMVIITTPIMVSRMKSKSDPTIPVSPIVTEINDDLAADINTNTDEQIPGYSIEEQVDDKSNDSYLEHQFTVKDNVDIYTNMYDATLRRNGLNPYYDRDSIRYIDGVAISYNEDLVFIYKNDPDAQKKIDAYLKLGGQIKSVLGSNISSLQEYEGFYNIDDIEIKKNIENKGVGR